MSIRSPGAAPSRFAHFASAARAALGGRKATKAEEEKERDEDDSEKEDEEEEDKEKSSDDDKEKERDEDASDGDDDEDDDKDKGDDKKEGKKAVAKARREERARCAAIFAAPSAAANVALACHLAFETGMSANAAVGALAAASPGTLEPAKADGSARRSLADRMNGEPRGTVPAGGAAPPSRDTPKGLAAFILGAGKSQGEK